jgi:hypothetical protein
LLLAVALVHGVGLAARASESHRDETEVRHRHHISAFLGGAVRDEHETEGGFALGLDYEYRLARLLGAGVLVEVTAGELRDVVVIVPVSLHPWRGLRLVAAPGANVPSEGDAEFLMRLGVGYRLPIGHFTLGPEFNADLIDGTPTYVFGVSFGVGF